MVKKLFAVMTFTGAVLLIFTKNAYANIGLPMIFLGVPFLVLAFIPVMVIEMYFYNRILNVALRRSGKGSFLANLVTTIVGYPISWGIHFAIGMAIGYPMGFILSKFQGVDWLGYALFPLISAWLMPGAEQWHIYLAGIFGLIPAFIISVKVEGKVLQKIFHEHDSQDVKRAVWKANRATYTILAIFLASMTLYHGLIKLHAFDHFRDKSEERVVFQDVLKGKILVSSDKHDYTLDPISGRQQKMFIEKSTGLQSDGLPPAHETEIRSPRGDYLASLKMLDNHELHIISHGPYLIHAELIVYDHSTMKEVSTAELWGIFRYTNLNQFSVSWHPNADAIYFSSLENTGNTQTILKQLDLKDFDRRYGTDEWGLDTEDMSLMLMEINTSLKPGIFEFDLNTKKKRRFVDGVAIISWHPSGDLVLIKNSSGQYQVFDVINNTFEELTFENLNKNREPVLSWSKDGKFIVYLGDSDHYLDKHHYRGGMYWRKRPGWVWIKELKTGKERMFDSKPINPAYKIKWIE